MPGVQAGMGPPVGVVAGSGVQVAVGTGVAGGMLTATVLGIYFIPLFYLAVRRWISRERPVTLPESAPAELEPTHA